MASDLPIFHIVRVLGKGEGGVSPILKGDQISDIGREGAAVLSAALALC